ncbi:MAG: CerR family C-terminal domain-containing protein [Planctomycetes bacterium]|nr:CerR family C-terminal domain-containing protein [Planctomycetota bacterium]
MAVKRSDGIETKRKLMEAAGPIFALEGYHNAKIADICHLAGANVASVNYYFGSKESLYVQTWIHAFEESLKAYPPDGGVTDTAPAEKRLHGQITALMNRIMDPASIDFDIAHKEMANPTGLLSEAMHTYLAPLREQMINVIKEILGEGSTPQQVQLCEMCIKSMCFGPLMRERHMKNSPNKCKMAGPPPLIDVNIADIVEHILKFSVAGIREIKKEIKKSTTSRKTGKKEE